MEDKTESIKFDEEGFATTKKGVTLPVLSTVIWILTGMGFFISCKVFNQSDYVTFTFITSLGLSVFFGILLVRRMLRNADLLSKIVLGLINILMIYSSANGIQAGYCFFSQTDSDEIQCAETKASLIPFIPAKPWLPARETRTVQEVKQPVESAINEKQITDPLYNEIAKLKEENSILFRELEELKNQQKASVNDCDSLRRKLREFQSIKSILTRTAKDSRSNLWPKFNNCLFTFRAILPEGKYDLIFPDPVAVID
jgi:hypothetical protein